MQSRRARCTALSLLAIAGSFFIAGSMSYADEVIMRDGTVHTGKVVSRNRRSVTIDTEIHGISTRLELDRRQVKSIVISEEELTAPSGADSNEDIPTLPSMAEANEDENKVLKRDGYNLILEVPLEGTFGKDIYPLGVANSLKWAKENGVTDVVFRINSGGGALWCANDMVAIMKDYREDIRMHMLIESAISASIWPSFMCHTITMTPGSDFGGAVGYTRNATGSAEVDLKMNSIMSAKLESTADANGHSGYLVRAMILSEAAVYAYKDANDEWVFANSTEGLPKGYETIDGPDTVLTLTAKQAIKYGIVDAMEEGTSLEEFCKVQGIEKWDNAGEYGQETVEKNVAQCQRIQNQLETTINAFYTDLTIAADRNTFTGVGSALQGMRKNLGYYKRLMREAEELHMPSILDSFEQAIDVTYYENFIEDRMADLRRWRRGP